MAYPTGEYNKTPMVPILIIFLCVGIAALLAGGLGAYYTANFLRTAVRTSGVVTKAGNHGDVRFTTAGGRGHTLYRGISTEQRPAIEWMPDPDRPFNACLATFGSTWIFAIGTLALGVTFTVIGGGGLIAKAIYKDEPVFARY